MPVMPAEVVNELEKMYAIIPDPFPNAVTRLINVFAVSDAWVLPER